MLKFKHNMVCQEIYNVKGYTWITIPDSTPPVWWIGHWWLNGGSHRHRWATRGVLSGMLFKLSHVGMISLCYVV